MISGGTSIYEEIATSLPLAAPRNDMLVDSWLQLFYCAINNNEKQKNSPEW